MSPRNPSTSARPSPPPDGGVGEEAAGGHGGQNLVDQAEALLHLTNAQPDARVDVALGQRRNVEFQPIVRRIGQIAAGVESPSGGAADKAAAAELPRQRRAQDACAGRAVLQGRGVFIKFDQWREGRAQGRHEVAQHGGRFRVEIGSQAAGNNDIHHQAMAEADIAGPQHPFAQHAAMGEHQREGRVVADAADVAEMVGETLQLRHQRPDPISARRRLKMPAPPPTAREKLSEQATVLSPDRRAAKKPARSSAAPAMRLSTPLWA